MIDELSKTIKSQLHERVGSPLLSSFVLAWLGWNFKIFIIIFSEIEPAIKLRMIDAILFPTNSSYLTNGFAYRLCIAAFLIFVYPWPAKWIYEYTRWRQNEIKKVQQKYDDEKPLTNEEARKIRTAALEETMALENIIEKKLDEIRILKESLTKSESDLRESKKSLEDTYTAIKQNEDNLKDALKNNENLKFLITQIKSNRNSDDANFIEKANYIYSQVKQFFVDNKLDAVHHLHVRTEDNSIIISDPEHPKITVKRYEFSIMEDPIKEIERITKLISKDLADNKFSYSSTFIETP